MLWVFAEQSLACSLCGAAILRDVVHLTHLRLDAASVALIGILYGISTIFAGSVVATIISIAIGCIMMVLFVKRQGKLEEPLIDLRPLKIALFTVGVIANMLSLVTVFAMNIIVPTFMQTVLGTPSLIASLTLFQAILCSRAASPIAGRVYDKHGPSVLLPLGFACIAIFSVLTALFIATASPVLLAIIYIPAICGSALVIGPAQSFALSKLPPDLNPQGVDKSYHGCDLWRCVCTGACAGGRGECIVGRLGIHNEDGCLHGFADNLCGRCYGALFVERNLRCACGR